MLAETLSASWWLFMNRSESEMPPACSVGIILTLDLQGAKAEDHLLPAESQLRYAMLWVRNRETADLLRI